MERKINGRTQNKNKRNHTNYCTIKAFLAFLGRPRFLFWPSGTLLASGGAQASFLLILVPNSCLHCPCFMKAGHVHVTPAGVTTILQISVRQDLKSSKSTQLPSRSSCLLNISDIIHAFIVDDVTKYSVRSFASRCSIDEVETAH